MKKMNRIPSVFTSWHALSIIAIVVLLGGCVDRPHPGMLVPVADTSEGASRLRVLAATTRQRTTTDPGEMFSGDRSDDVSYASVVVSIPPDDSRKVGEIQWPAAPPGDSRRDFVTVSAN